MTPADALELAQAALQVTLVVCAPVVLAALVVGGLVAFLQALTQVQEMTLAFVPKIVAVLVTMLVFAPYLGHQLSAFANLAWSRIEVIR